MDNYFRQMNLIVPLTKDVQKISAHEREAQLVEQGTFLLPFLGGSFVANHFCHDRCHSTRGGHATRGGREG